MRISRTRRLVIDLGQYERLEFASSVTMGHEDLGMTDDDARQECKTEKGRRQLEDDLIDCVMECVNRQLLPEIEEAARLTTEEKSVLRRIMAEHGERVSERTTYRRRD